MATNIDQSDWPSTLPRPELNPLINPILGQNLGRWAEVYFTSAPEKREEAVIRLLRELQGQGSAQPAEGVTPSASPEPAPLLVDATAHSISVIPQATTACSFCGRKNPAAHRFCSLCGRSVQGGGAADSHAVASAPNLRAAELRSNPGASPSEFVASKSSAIDLARIEGGPKFQGGRDPEGLFIDAHSSAPSRRYRFYASVAAVVVILGLAYFVSRSVRPSKASRQAESQAASVSVPKTSEPEPARPNQSPADGPDQPSTASPITQRQTVPPPAQTLAGTPAMTQAAEKEPLASSAPENGAEELVTAKRYLNGTDGVAMDSGKAADWLWKAVSKHNPDAPILLANLYLKGKGVEKNCDQARLLLDAAAQRGIPSAGEQLRHIHVYGCP